MMMRQLLFVGSALLSLAAPLSAQRAGRGQRGDMGNMNMAAATGMPESYKTVQLSALQRQRATLLAMADSMPENLYRDKVTPIQRDFAQQVHHAAYALGFVVPMVLHVPGPTGLPDTSAVFNTRAGLKAYINGTYDWAANTLRNQTAESRAATVNLFGTQIPGWQLWDEMHQHTFWTAGQIVANFRKNGMAPPGFGFF